MTRPSPTLAARQPSISPLSFVVITGTGLLLVWCSYLFEVHAIRVLLLEFGLTPLFPSQDLILAQGVAGGLNLAKVALSIIIAQQIVAGRQTFVAQSGRLLVFTLSMTLVLVVFGSETVSPFARATYDARLTQVDQAHGTAVSDLERRLDARVAEIAARFAAARAEEAEIAHARLADLQAQLDVERTVGYPNFRGPAYIEIERLIGEANATIASRLDQLLLEERNAIAAIEAERQQARAALDEARDRESTGIDLTEIATAPEAQHPAIVAFARIAAKLGGREVVEPILMTVGMSLLMTLTLELLPMILLTHAFRAAGEARLARMQSVTAAAATDKWPAPVSLGDTPGARPDRDDTSRPHQPAASDVGLRIAAE